MAGDVVVDYKNKDNIYELGDIITFILTVEMGK